MPLTYPLPRRAALVLILWSATICPPLSAPTDAPVRPTTAPALGSVAIPPPASASGPAAAAKAFDSLLTAGNFEQARNLCTGQVLRMFDLIALAQAKMADAVDTSRSTDTTLDEKLAGAWAYLKVSSLVVFKRPLLGQDSIRSVQAIHLFHEPRGWLVAEIEELDGMAAKVRLRTGLPSRDADDTKDAHAPPEAQNIFPISAKAPATSGEIDRMKYRISLKNDASLAPLCALGPEQKLIRAESDSRWILENRRPKLKRAQVKPRAIKNQELPDSLQPYMTTNGFLILEDSLLIETAARLAGKETDPERIAEKIYVWVMADFQFEFGAVLFGTSREVLRGMTGDCSEAAILTTALLRARGIPARVALGFASVGRGIFIGHAWTEAFLGDQWVGVDAALRQFPAGVERVKLAGLDGKTDMRVMATNLMMSVLANFDIEILSAWKNGKPVTLQRFSGNSAEGLQFFENILKGMDKP